MSRFSDIHIEQDFWNDFIVEAFEHIDSIETNAMSLEQHPEDMEIIHTMFRAFHTIKGLAGFVEHSVVQELAHKTETLMDFCRKGELKVNTAIVNAILQTSDFIKLMCNEVDSYKDEALIERVEKHLIVLESLSKAEEIQAPSLTPEIQPTQEPTQAFEQSQQEESIQEQAVIEQPQEQPQSEIENSEVQPQEAAPEIAFEQNQDAQEPIVEGLEAFAEEITEIENEQNEKTEELPVETSENQKVEQNTQPVEIPPTNNEGAQAKPEIPEALSSFQQNVLKKLNGTDDKTKEENEATQKRSSSNEEYMKVANSKIDHLVDMISELIISQSLIEQYVFQKYNDDRALVTNLSGFLRITRELQNLSMSLRMVSLKSTFQKVARIARDTIQELHKDVEVIMTGENTEIDRVVAEKLLDPLVHMIKNAISHGVEENQQDRINLGKPPKATVELSAYSKRGKIYIEVKDDGKGINTEIVYQKALEKGIIDTTKNYSESEIKEFIMLPGFSTAKVVDNISGRGVGMDVVKTQIFKIGGKVDIHSELNKGSAFVLEVPVNHAIMNGTIIDMNNQEFVVPTVNVKEILQPTESQWIFTKSKRTMIKVRENIIPIVQCSSFSLNPQKQQEIDDYERNIPLVMVLELDQELRALPIDNVINRQEVVVKPVSTEFSHLKFISGMSILGTGKVSLILDMDYLFRKEIKE